jgi:hypothetical protein
MIPVPVCIVGRVCYRERSGKTVSQIIHVVRPEKIKTNGKPFINWDEIDFVCGKLDKKSKIPPPPPF